MNLCNILYEFVGDFLSFPCEKCVLNKIYKCLIDVAWKGRFCMPPLSTVYNVSGGCPAMVAVPVTSYTTLLDFLGQ